jgi:hypothetical protein
LELAMLIAGRAGAHRPKSRARKPAA